MPRRFDGVAVARQIYGELGLRLERLVSRGVTPRLTAVLVGDNPSSRLYVGNKRQACERLGVESRVLELPADTPEEVLLERIRELNQDDATHGILIQLPLPDHIRTERAIDAVDPNKDVDGFHPLNKGLLLEGRARLYPCTPAGIMKLLDAYGIQVEGMHAVVLGRSNIVGKPVAFMLMQRHATVTICHSRTRDLADIVGSADLLVAAVGRPAFVQPDWIRPECIIIDVGINPVTDEVLLQNILPPEHPRWKAFQSRGRLILGDVHPAAYEKAAGYTPVPGGVGPLTVAMVVHNTITAAEIQTGADA